MTYLPEEWEVSHIRELHEYDDMAKPVDGKLWLAAQLAVSPSPGDEGYYRLVVVGDTQLEVKLEASSIIPDDNLKRFWLYGQFEASRVAKLANNCCVSAWMDVLELVAAQDLDVYDQDGNSATDDFLEAMAAAKKANPTIGAAWRWAVSVNPASKERHS